MTVTTIIHSYLFVDKDNSEWIGATEPYRDEENGEWVCVDDDHFCGSVTWDATRVPQGTIKKIIGRTLTWEDDYVTISGT
jgi:hypothetical protein